MSCEPWQWRVTATVIRNGAEFAEPHVEEIAILVPQILTQMIQDSGGAQPPDRGTPSASSDGAGGPARGGLSNRVRR